MKGLSILLIFFMWGSLGGQYVESGYSLEESSLVALKDTAVISIIMMIVPLCFRLYNKAPLEYEKGEKICRYNSIIAFCLSIVLTIVVMNGNGFFGIGGLGAIIYYFVNKWMFVITNKKDAEKKYNKKIIKGIIIILIIFVVIISIATMILYLNTNDDITNDSANNNIIGSNTNYNIKSNKEEMISSTPPKSSIPNEYIGIWELLDESTIYTLIIDDTTFTYYNKFVFEGETSISSCSGNAEYINGFLKLTVTENDGSTFQKIANEVGTEKIFWISDDGREFYINSNITQIDGIETFYKK